MPAPLGVPPPPTPQALVRFHPATKALSFCLYWLLRHACHLRSIPTQGLVRFHPAMEALSCCLYWCYDMLVACHHHFHHRDWPVFIPS